MRIPYAMRAMIGEIEKINESAVLETREPDGFGVWRALTLDTVTTERMRELLDVLDDPRIEAKYVIDGQYGVRFTSDRRADDAKPFSLDKAYLIATGAQEEEPEEPVERDDDGPTRDERAKVLKAKPVADLRVKYNFPDSMKKAEIVDQILTDEGY